MIKKEEKYILYSIIILFGMGSLVHFIYNITGKLRLIGSITPVNESIWEHTKLVLIPIIFLYLIYYIFNKNLNKNRWFTSMITSLTTSIITIPLLYYFYTGAFGIESSIINILILLISFALGQLLGLFVYKNSSGISIYISIIFTILIIIMYIVFTFYPPKLPIFYDFNTGNYGILKE